MVDAVKPDMTALARVFGISRQKAYVAWSTLELRIALAVASAPTRYMPLIHQAVVQGLELRDRGIRSLADATEMGLVV